MKVGDLVRVKSSQCLSGDSDTGMITGAKGRGDPYQIKIFWVLIDGLVQTYGRDQLIKHEKVTK